MKTLRLAALMSLVGSCTLILSSLSAAEEPVPRRVVFDIAAQTIGDALNTFARQSGLQVLFQSQLGKDVIAPPVQGTLSPEQALEQLLATSGLHYEFVNARTVTIRANTIDPDSEKSPTAGADTQSGRIDFIRLAHPQSTTHGQESGATTANERLGSRDTWADQETGESIALEEIVVTGSHLRGSAAAGSKVIAIGKDEIARSGYGTVQDVIKSLPMNFAAGVSEDFNTEIGNFNHASSPNLRGLGADSTLVLVNGRRQAAGGINGVSVDVSSIAASAVERIEVLTDGASAIYGSDAVGGVVNIILRKDYEGAETRARLGTLSGDADETQISQLLGTGWSSGHLLAGYQHFKRESLGRFAREYAADTDQRRFGGSNFSTFLSSPGNILDPATRLPAFAIPDGQDGDALTVDDLTPGTVRFANGANGNDLLPEQRMHSAFLDISQSIGQRMDLYAEARFAQRDTSQQIGTSTSTLVVPSANPFYVNPFGGTAPVRVAYNFINDLGPRTGAGRTETYDGALGATLRLGEAWRVKGFSAYGREWTRWNSANLVNSTALTAALADPNPATAFNAFGDGGDNNPATLDAIRRGSEERAVGDLWSTTVIADGPLWGLPSGAMRLAVGADYRDEGLFAGTAVRVPSDLGREVYAGFLELAVPLIGTDNARPGARRLDLSLAARYEHYSDFGDTLNPKFGFSWSPLASLAVRGSWGTSFRAPNLVELTEVPRLVNADQLRALPDPNSPTGLSFALLRFGNNAGLQEETARTWTAGVDITPPAIPGLAVALTYYDIDFEDRVVIPGPLPNFLNILLVENLWSDVITRNPSAADVAAICGGPLFLDPPSNCAATPPTVIVDFRLRNLSAVDVKGLDLDFRYPIETKLGALAIDVAANYVVHFSQAVTDASPFVDVVDTLNNPLRLRLRGSLSWTLGRFGATATVNHADDYKDTVSQPNRDIDEWTTLDLNLTYTSGEDAGLLQNTSVALSAVNVLDEAPPFANVPLGYDAANADPYGRLLSIQLTKGW